MQTFFRFVVMLVTVAIVWKGWQLYGPPADQLKSIASRAVEMADRALNGGTNSDGATLNPDDPRTAAPPLAGPSATAPDLSATPVALPLATTPNSPSLLPAEAADAKKDDGSASTMAANSAGEAKPASPFEPSSSATQQAEDHGSVSPLELALARLEQLGIRDHQLESWGESGAFYRFSCRVPWGEAASFTRHFESVAAEPLAAVEAVAAKVDAWRAVEQ